MVFFLGTQRVPIMFSVFLILFQITMPKCHKTNPNCFWHVPTEWFGLNFISALLSESYWNYAIHIVRVCVSPFSAINLQTHFYKKSKNRPGFGSRDMASLYELLCHHSLNNTDPLIVESLS